ncbi:FMN-binding protein [Micromonospora sp. LH3U1]|uniref:FMN-binding protein n=1 Tax=Micromonospora sp. LH3U1 TaxID=3018339 RepID=UPI00234B3135|nr:FMN-binding protein [Micromonospora sp. LH3U1]WCN80149.1 FMN-binding protein [Micromonospora sp. LH3U1]
MRRALLAITGLAASTTALVVFKGSPATNQVAQNLPTAQPVNPTPQDVDPNAAPGADPAGAEPTPSVTGKAPASPKPTKSTPRPSGTSTTTKAPSAPRTTKAPQPTTRRFTGPPVTAVDNTGAERGEVQVQIVVSGNRIIEANAVQMPNEGESEFHSSDVRRKYEGAGGEVVTKQSANLSTVSGATATSNAYKQSLRAAIEEAF